jgi:hypothetical protein
MTEGWGEFYFMIGSSAAGLIGLLFVVATLTADIEQHRALKGVKLFMTPTVFHFAVVLVISALATTQEIHPDALAAVMGAAAFLGIVYIAQRLAGLLRPKAVEDWTDILFYGAVPMIGYIALGGAAWSVYATQPFAALLTAGLMLGFLLLGIRNAWDLVTWIAPRTGRSDPRAEPVEGPSKESAS